MPRRLRVLVPLLVGATATAAPIAAPLRAQLPAPEVAADTGYVRYNAMIPMRDGVRLNTEIFVPKRTSGKVPILLIRTPYGVGPNAVLGTQPGRSLYELAQDGYVFVAQDLRGRFKSEGQFVMMRAPRDPKVRNAIDEASDAYDTVDWLVKHVPNNNGRAGIFGVSYAGWTAAMALLDPHPALRAASPQASPADMFLGDDFHHNGAFRLSYGYEYATMMETGKEIEPVKFDTYDTYDWYLKLGPLANATAKLQGKLPTWTDFSQHHAYDEFWQKQTIVRYLTKPLTVPTLNVAGWWDQEDFFGPFAIYQALEKQDRQNRNFLVVGPWNHGGWNRAEGKTLGKIDFGAATSLYFRERIQAPFFRCQLHGRCDAPQPEALVFESGANEWRTYDSWPPKQGIQQRALYFGPNGTLSWSPPAAAGAAGAAAPTAMAADTTRAFDEFVSDPNKPVPYRPRPIEATYDERGSGWGAWQVEDQRFVHNRPDVLSWQTEPLTEDVTIAGDVLAEMFASTTGSDADWIVKLIDVYPDMDTTNVKMSGYQLMVSGEVFRARFRNSFEKPEALVPNQPTPVRFGLHGQAYRFKKGHRIMVQVQSSWFPVIDRNPQTFVPNIFEAKASDFRAAAHRVFRSADMPSHLTLPVKEPFRP
ncbi:CocE/NonD family hydrolase [Roseisolibacter agri]|uniref:Glutaryl-7-ACA acylase n=1 Tax=Roseisolibacter agri TaxID=2014610 RepID=A0AA37VEC8_9BACT|nr:CocE/NonD family hydrolase [Roseisolibacter agri]GLC24959.1 glutaryl-7-ACA acylase [Roseisolibacter agri]